MPIYKVKLKGTEEEEVIEAMSELEAKFKYCQQKKLSYRVYAHKLEAVKEDKQSN